MLDRQSSNASLKRLLLGIVWTKDVLLRYGCNIQDNMAESTGITHHHGDSLPRKRFHRHQASGPIGDAVHGFGWSHRLTSVVHHVFSSYAWRRSGGVYIGMQAYLSVGSAIPVGCFNDAWYQSTAPSYYMMAGTVRSYDVTTLSPILQSHLSAQYEECTAFAPICPKPAVSAMRTK